MKKVFLPLISFCLLATLSWAQSVPQGMKYQAVARDLSGNVIADEEITLKISLYTLPKGGNKVAYQETHQIVTNTLGLFSLVVGEGRTELGQFDLIPWSTNDIWMEIALKDKSQAEFITISDTKMLSVPYAFHAGSAEKLLGGDDSGRDPGNGVPANVWSLFGNSAVNDLVDHIGTTNCADFVMITNHIERLRITCAGDVNIATNLNVGNDLHVDHNATIDNDVQIGNNLNVDKTVTLNTLGGSTTNKGPLTVSNLSPTLLTGSLTVNGVTNLNNTFNVNNMAASYLSGTLTVDKHTELNSTLNVDGATNLFSTLKVNNMAASHLTGTLTVDKHTELNSTLNVDGAASFQSTLAANGQVTINGGVAGDESNYNAYQLRVQGGNQGIAVKANNWDESSNFMSFWTGGTMRGRVEAQNPDNLHGSFDYIWTQAMFAVEEALIIAEGICTGVQLDLCETVVMAVEGAAVFAQWLEFTINSELNVGVSYESGSGDYAEWLEKLNQGERFAIGDIVGVVGGKISKNTKNADHFMVVSMSPIVLGNMPDEANKAAYEKVAFLGQVPAKVLGPVEVGDYILPSGRDDGMGIAVSPEEMTIDDYQKIVGVAWSAGGSSNLNLINMAVGINTNDLAMQMKSMQTQINTIAAYLQSKDPNLDLGVIPTELGPETPAVTPQEPVTVMTREEILNRSEQRYDFIQEVMQRNPEYFREGLRRVKEEYVKNGIPVDEIPELKKAFEDETYMLSVVKEHLSR